MSRFRVCALAVAGVAVAAILTTAAGHAMPASGPGPGPDREPREQDVPAYEPIGAADATVGRIEIPRVGVSSVILEGVDYKTIRRAVGHFPATTLPNQTGNMALAAHRTTDFYGLRNIRIGDEVTITSAQGSFHYQVERTWVVDPEGVWVLDPAPEKVLTLVTCYPFDYQGSAPQRFIVRARAVPSRPSGEVAPAAAPCPAID